jgi:prepilin-type N-terminal cleavage/methylation domain-containing protein
MRHSIQQRKQQGFTIIEVLIVLAIAGLIMLIVFLAVPALQRNSRNTQRKDDVARVGGAVQEFTNNHNGTLPTNSAADNTTLQGEFGKLAYYTNTNVTVSGGAPAAVTNGTDADHVNIYTDAVCASMTGGMGATSTGATTRNVAVVYSSESGSGTDKLCTTF